MRGDIAQLVKIITMKIAASLECHVLQHCALPGHKLIPIFQKERGGGGGDRARMRTRGARLNATKLAESLGVCLPPGSLASPQALPHTN